MTDLIQITNAGADIASTDYWESEHAARGLCYLSGNAGTWRLLLPSALGEALAEMRTGRSVTIEPSIAIRGGVDIVFRDGTDSPFSLTLDRRQIDRAMQPGACTLTVWTRAGRQLSLPAVVQDGL